MSNKKYWKNEPKYKRILEIIDSYWLSEEDESEVLVRLEFKRMNGEVHQKYVYWQNPNIFHDSHRSPVTISANKLLSMNLPFPCDSLLAKYDPRGWTENENSFYNWLIKRHYGEDTPIGDLANDAERDESFPVRASKYKQIKSYLDARGASMEAMEVFEKTWKLYSEEVSNCKSHAE